MPLFHPLGEGDRARPHDQLIPCNLLGRIEAVVPPLGLLKVRTKQMPVIAFGATRAIEIDKLINRVVAAPGISAPAIVG